MQEETSRPTTETIKNTLDNLGANQQNKFTGSELYCEILKRDPLFAEQFSESKFKLYMMSMSRFPATGVTKDFGSQGYYLIIPDQMDEFKFDLHLWRTN